MKMTHGPRTAVKAFGRPQGKPVPWRRFGGGTSPNVVQKL